MSSVKNVNITGKNIPAKILPSRDNFISLSMMEGREEASGIIAE